MKKKFDYSWVVVAICFLCFGMTMGFCSSPRNMYLTAITDVLGIKRSAYSITETFRYVTTMIINVFLGSLISKFGTKKLLCAGFGCFMAFTLIAAHADNLVTFYIAAIFMGAGFALTGTGIMGVIVNVWCKKNRGTITGAIFCANGLCGAISAQVLSPIIFKEGEPFGYRNAYLLVFALMAVMMILVLIFFRERPKDVEETSLPERKEKKTRGEGWIGMEYKDVVKKPYFYVALLCMAFTGMALQGLDGISIPHMYDMGLEKEFVATLLTFSSLCLMGGKFLVGFMCDRKSSKVVMNICLVCSFLSLFGLVMISNTSLGRGIAYARMIFFAIAMPMETVMLPILAQDLFGAKSFAKIVGLFSAATCLGFAFGAPFANLCYDLFESYNVSFIIFAGLMVFVTVALPFVFKSALRDRNIIEAQICEAESNVSEEKIYQ